MGYTISRRGASQRGRTLTNVSGCSKLKKETIPLKQTTFAECNSNMHSDHKCFFFLNDMQSMMLSSCASSHWQTLDATDSKVDFIVLT